MDDLSVDCEKCSALLWSTVDSRSSQYSSGSAHSLSSAQKFSLVKMAPWILEQCDCSWSISPLKSIKKSVYFCDGVEAQQLKSVLRLA